MGIAFTKIKGIVLCDSRRVYNGVTLFTPTDGTSVWLIDMLGRIVHHWDTGYRPGCYGELLPNGNLLYAGKVDDGPLADLEGAGGILLEADWDGNMVWEYRDPYLHHAFHRMKNGNTLVLKWVKVPEEIAAKVKGGDPGTEREGVMWGDVIQEISPDGKVAWEWIAHEHLDPEVDITCPICPRSTWTHANGVVELPDGDILVSFMKKNNVAIIDKKSRDIKWRWGKDELGHQHSVSVLDNSNILVFENGLHGVILPLGFSRVLEVSRETGEVVWIYAGGERPKPFFYSATMSNCQRLPNGNTLICEGTWGRIFEITPSGETVWEFVNNVSSSETPTAAESKPCSVYSAYRYGMDYSGLKRPIPLTEERQIAPGTIVKEEEAVKARLSGLGY